MSNVDDDINKEIQIEGGFKVVNNPADKGGKTVAGISAAANPDLFAGGRTPTEQEIRDRFLTRYVKAPGFDQIGDPSLQDQLIDFGVNSGPAIAIQKLQIVLKVPVDGILGPSTLSALSSADPKVVNNQVVAQRVQLIGRIVVKNPTQLQFLSGWLSRALEFLV